LRNHNAMIHTHRYDVFSTIYAGRLRHITYDLDYFADSPDVRIIQLDGASDAHKTPEIETGLTAELKMRHSYTLATGSTYNFMRGLFHQSLPVDDEPVVTIFERSNKSYEWAKVLCGINEPVATHAFDPASQPSEDTLWNAIGDALPRHGPIWRPISRHLGYDTELDLCRLAGL